MDEYNLIEKIQMKYKDLKKKLSKYYENINNVITSLLTLSVLIVFITTLTLHVHVAFYFLGGSIFVYAVWLIRLTIYRK